MASRLGQAWISAEKIENLVQLEPLLAILGLVFAAIVIYKIFLRGVSEERHRNLRRLFTNLFFHILFAAGTFIGYYALNHVTSDESGALFRVASYVGLASVISWCIVFVKVSRILLFEYLFLSHMRVGVPLLLVNLFSLLLTVLLGGWLATELFSVKIAPLLATSAIFSLVLGLAMQDTLGNLFAGVAMQFDKPYEIGDWIEVTVNDIKWVGQVHEISWRATVLIAIGDEFISIPNRLMGQTQITNYSAKTRPFCRSQLFRISHGESMTRAMTVLREAAGTVPSILKDPAPFTYAFESNESFVTIKLVYCIRDFGRQFIIGGDVIVAGNEALQRAGFELAPPRILVLHNPSSPQDEEEADDASAQTALRG